MPLVLTAASTILCAHAGPVQLLSTAKLTVAGAPVLLEDSLIAITGCAGPTPPGPCVKVTAVTTGRATKLTVGGRPVLLATLQATTNVGALAPVANAGQVKLNAI